MLLISNKASKEFCHFLEYNNISFTSLPSNPNLDPRIADHPDLSLCKLDYNTIVVDSFFYEYASDIFTGYNIIRGESPRATYPYDSIYNIYRGSDFYIHNEVTEANVKSYMKLHNITHLQVKQGYSRCSIIPLGDKIMTSDYGIYKALKDKIDVTLLKEEEVILDGFDNGFLGGCCGIYEDKLIFTGDIRRLKSYDIINNNADMHGLDLLYPENIDLVDLGSLVHI